VSKAMGLAIDKVVTARHSVVTPGSLRSVPCILFRPRLCWSSGDCAAGSVPAPERMLSMVSYQQRGSGGISDKPRRTFGLSDSIFGISVTARPWPSSHLSSRKSKHQPSE
jgi:hypothetical protein